MLQRYRVSIPVEATTQDSVDVSITHKLEDGLVLDNVLRVRVEGQTTYLDFEVIAKHRNAAITNALSMAARVLQLISLVYSKGFEVKLAGIQAMPIEPAEPPFEIHEDENHVRIVLRDTLHVSEHWRITEHISTLEALLPLWELVNQNNSVVADGLEWLYLGKIASNERMAFLAHWLAFELLVERAPGNEHATTVLKEHVPTKKDRSMLKEEMTQVIGKYIQDDVARERLIKYMEQAKLESDIDRWTRILQKNGVNIQPKEVQGLTSTRGSIVHQSDQSKSVTSLQRLRELVVEYINILLLAEK
jgi:hypothetical protein